MIDEIKAHWWWLTALGAAIAGGVRWLFGMQAQIDRLSEKQLADKSALVQDVVRLEQQLRTVSGKVDDLSDQLGSDYAQMREAIGRVEAQNAMMISILNARK
jgi:TolA-binding protein